MIAKRRATDGEWCKGLCWEVLCGEVKYSLVGCGVVWHGVVWCGVVGWCLAMFRQWLLHSEANKY